jgi:hypothetical protein
VLTSTGTKSEIPPTHRLKPPPPRERERKVRVGNTAIYSLVGAAINHVTETCDLIAAFYKALPAEFRYGRKLHKKGGEGFFKPYKNPGCPKMWLAVAANWSKVDLNQALRNLVKNEVEDHAIGKLNSGANQSLGNNPYYRGLRGQGITRAGPDINPQGLPKPTMDWLEYLTGWKP